MSSRIERRVDARRARLLCSDVFKYASIQLLAHRQNWKWQPHDVSCILVALHPHTVCRRITNIWTVRGLDCYGILQAYQKKQTE